MCIDCKTYYSRKFVYFKIELFKFDYFCCIFYVIDTESNSLSDSINLLKSLIGKSNTKKKYVQKSWFLSVQSSEVTWKECRNNIWQALFSREVVKETCSYCLDRPANIICDDCKNSSLCYICDDIVHTSHPLHDRDAYINGYRQPLSPQEHIINEELEIGRVGKTFIVKQQIDGKDEY